MCAETTTIAGDAISQLCLKHAGMLNFDIYDTPRSALPAELQPYWDINNSYWDEEWRIEEADGFRAALYTPKSSQDQTEEGLCPSVLVFRGSDSEPEDFAELAGALRINYDYDVRIAGRSLTSGTGSVDRSFSAAASFNGKTMAEMDASGLQKEALFDNVPGSKSIQVGGWAWSRATLTLNWETDAALYYGTSGDWAVNFAQGLGVVIPPQYLRAIQIGRNTANTIMASDDKRLIITGHSLGGGLASAAAIAARVEQPELFIQGVTFNAAGLHANTAQRAGGTRSTASEVPVRAVHVKDEILNSMQATSRMVPILADLLVWGNKSMPSAVANPSASPGISPGPMPITRQAYAPKFGNLPILYTVDRQTLGPTLVHMQNIVAVANASSTVTTFIDQTVDYLIAQLRQDNILTYGEVISMAEGLHSAREEIAELGEPILEAIMHGGDVPEINIGDTDYRNTVLEPFFNGMIADSVMIARILLASGEYHTFLPCAFTFLLDPP